MKKNILSSLFFLSVTVFPVKNPYRLKNISTIFLKEYKDLPIKIRECLNENEDPYEVYDLAVKLKKEKNYLEITEKDIVCCFEYIIDRYDTGDWTNLDNKTIIILQKAYDKLNKYNRLAPIFSEDIDVEICYGKDLLETYNIGLAFKKGEGDTFQNDKIKSLAASFKCFSYINKRSYENLNPQEREIISRSYYQMGWLYYRYSRSQRALNCFGIAVTLGTDQEKKLYKVLDKLK